MYVESPMKSLGSLTSSGKKKKKKKNYRKNLPTLDAFDDIIHEKQIEETPTGIKTIIIPTGDPEPVVVLRTDN